MRPLYPLTLLLACGPIAPPFDAGSTTDDTTTAPPATTTPPPNPTTASPSTTTGDPTTTAAPPDPTTTAAETTSQDFIVTPDGGPFGTVECDVFGQDCDPGQKCVPYAEGGGSAWNASRCVDITGDGAPGEPCFAPEGGVAGIDDCALGAICWDVDETKHGTCIAQCSGSPNEPVCPAKTSCSIAADGVLAICISGCEPLLQDCPGDELCIANGDAFLCVLDASGDEGQVNDPCEFANSCDKGLLCLNTAAASIACMQGSQGCCQPLCEFIEGQTGDCPNPDQACLQWFDPMMPIPPGLENVGVCAIPT